MTTAINEHIAVSGVYSDQEVGNQLGGARFRPMKFRWRGVTYPIDQITSESNVRDGTILRRRYHVLSGGNEYHLQFDRTAEQWALMEVWCE